MPYLLIWQQTAKQHIVRKLCNCVNIVGCRSSGVLLFYTGNYLENHMGITWEKAKKNKLLIVFCVILLYIYLGIADFIILEPV